MSLVEVLIVIALMAVLTGSLLGSRGLLAGSRLRGAATMVLMGIRQGMTIANTTGLPTRLVFDIDENRLSLEQSAERMLRKRADDPEDTTAGAEPSTEAERAAREEAAAFLEGPREPPPSFVPIAGFDFDPDDGAPGRALGQDVTLLSVHTEHDAKVRVAGRAYLYFWPGGGTERAVIQLTRVGREAPLSVLVSALTGRAELVSHAVDFEEPSADVDFGEREVEE